MSYESYQVQPLDLSVKSSSPSAMMTADFGESVSKHKSAVFHHHQSMAAAAAMLAVGGSSHRRISESSDYGLPEDELRSSDEFRAGPRKRYLSKFLNNSSGKNCFNDLFFYDFYTILCMYIYFAFSFFKAFF